MQRIVLQYTSDIIIYPLFENINLKLYCMFFFLAPSGVTRENVCENCCICSKKCFYGNLFYRVFSVNQTRKRLFVVDQCPCGKDSILLMKIICFEKFFTGDKIHTQEKAIWFSIAPYPQEKTLLIYFPLVKVLSWKVFFCLQQTQWFMNKWFTRSRKMILDNSYYVQCACSNKWISEAYQ